MINNKFTSIYNNIFLEQTQFVKKQSLHKLIVEDQQQNSSNNDSITIPPQFQKFKDLYVKQGLIYDKDNDPKQELEKFFDENFKEGIIIGYEYDEESNEITLYDNKLEQVKKNIDSFYNELIESQKKYQTFWIQEFKTLFIEYGTKYKKFKKQKLELAFDNNLKNNIICTFIIINNVIKYIKYKYNKIIKQPHKEYHKIIKSWEKYKTQHSNKQDNSSIIEIPPVFQKFKDIFITYGIKYQQDQNYTEDGLAKFFDKNFKNGIILSFIIEDGTLKMIKYKKNDIIKNVQRYYNNIKNYWENYEKTKAEQEKTEQEAKNIDKQKKVLDNYITDMRQFNFDLDYVIALADAKYQTDSIYITPATLYDMLGEKFEKHITRYLDLQNEKDAQTFKNLITQTNTYPITFKNTSYNDNIPYTFYIHPAIYAQVINDSMRNEYWEKIDDDGLLTFNNNKKEIFTAYKKIIDRAVKIVRKYPDYFQKAHLDYKDINNWVDSLKKEWNKD